MKTTVKLLGFTVATAAILAGCTGNLPTNTGTGDLSKPGFTVTVTKNGQPVSGYNLFLKQFNNVSEGQFGNSSATGTSVKTDSNGIAFVEAPQDAVNGGALFGVGYDAANTQFGGNRDKVAQSNNTDEIQWFTTPAVNLNTKTGKRVSLNFDVAWATAGFSPANGGTVQGPNVTFQLAPKQGATKYEVVVSQGNVAGTGSPAAPAGSLTSATPSITWTGAKAGTYNYQAKAFLPSGMAGIDANQTASSWLVFSVTGAQ